MFKRFLILGLVVLGISAILVGCSQEVAEARTMDVVIQDDDSNNKVNVTSNKLDVYSTDAWTQALNTGKAYTIDIAETLAEDASMTGYLTMGNNTLSVTGTFTARATLQGNTTTAGVLYVYENTNDSCNRNGYNSS